MQWRLQPCAVKAATLCSGGCNPVQWTLQPRAVEAAAPCARGCIAATPCTQVGAAVGAAAPHDLRLQAAPDRDPRAAAGGHVRRPARPLPQAERLHVRLRARARRRAATEGLPTCRAPCNPTHPACHLTHPACSPTHPACHPLPLGLPAAALARRAHLRLRLVLLLDQEEQGGHRPRRRASRAIA